MQIKRSSGFWNRRQTSKAGPRRNGPLLRKGRATKPNLARPGAPSVEKLDALWTLAIKLRDKRIDPICRICSMNYGNTAYHIIPKQRGQAIRWLLENGCLSCGPCNDGERLNRSLYRDKHVAIFGQELVERIEKIARDANGKQTDKFAVHKMLKDHLEGR